MKQILLVMMMLCSLTASAQSRVKNMYADSQSLNVAQLENTDQTVRLHRYLFAGYNTLCLPMSLNSQQLSQAARDLRVERFAGIRQQGSTLCLYFVDCTGEGIEAGVPYLIFSPTRQYLRVNNTDAERIDSNLKTLRVNDGQGNQVAFSSNWTVLQKDDHYGIPAKQNVEILESVLIRTTSDMSLLPTRCSFSWEQQAAGAERLEIMHVSANEATAIENLTTARSEGVGVVYDLQGRRLTDNNHRGVVIQNGKKLFSK